MENSQAERLGLKEGDQVSVHQMKCLHIFLTIAAWKICQEAQRSWELRFLV